MERKVKGGQKLMKKEIVIGTLLNTNQTVGVGQEILHGIETETLRRIEGKTMNAEMNVNITEGLVTMSHVTIKDVIDQVDGTIIKADGQHPNIR